MGAGATLRTWAALLLLVVPASPVAAAIDGDSGGNGGAAAAPPFSCPTGCVCSAAEVSCRNLDLEDAPVEELRGGAAAGRDWSGVTKL